MCVSRIAPCPGYLLVPVSHGRASILSREGSRSDAFRFETRFVIVYTSKRRFLLCRLDYVCWIVKPLRISRGLFHTHTDCEIIGPNGISYLSIPLVRGIISFSLSLSFFPLFLLFFFLRRIYVFILRSKSIYHALRTCFLRNVAVTNNCISYYCKDCAIRDRCKRKCFKERLVYIRLFSFFSFYLNVPKDTEKTSLELFLDYL